MKPRNFFFGVLPTVLVVISLYAFYLGYNSPKGHIASNTSFHNQPEHHIIENSNLLFYDEPPAFRGPEAFLETQDNRLFTTTYHGKIVQLVVDENSRFSFVVVASTGKTGDCKGPEDLRNESIKRECSRPLGMALSEDGEIMYVADAWKGLLEIDVRHTIRGNDEAENEKYKSRLVSWFESHQINEFGETLNVKVLAQRDQHGNLLVFADGIAVHNHFIYFTGLTSGFYLDQLISEFVAPDFGGRLYRYDLKSGKVMNLKENLTMPNGLVKSFDGESLLMVTGGDEVHKYHLEGSKKGEIEVFIKNVGVLLDNITKHPTLPHYFITGASERSKLLNALLTQPILRTFARYLIPSRLHSKLMFLITDRWVTLRVSASGQLLQSFGLTPSDPRVKRTSEYYETRSGVGIVGCYGSDCNLTEVLRAPSLSYDS